MPGMPHDQGPQPGESAAAWAEGAERPDEAIQPDQVDQPTRQPLPGFNRKEWGWLVLGALSGSFLAGVITGFLK